MLHRISRRVMAVAGLLALAACGNELTAPTRSAAMLSTRRGVVQRVVAVRAVHRWGARRIAGHESGDSAKFDVKAGEHSAGATAPTLTGLSIWFPQMVTLAPGQRYVLTMRC